jgi:hypothetical protein
MSPKYFMISNRILQDGDLANIRGPLTFWLTDNANGRYLKNWNSVSDRTVLVTEGLAPGY